jgi:hypothetical protein
MRDCRSNPRSNECGGGTHKHRPQRLNEEAIIRKDIAIAIYRESQELNDQEYNMRNDAIPSEERSRYKINRSHRNQTINAVVSKDRDTYAWTWHGHIEFSDGQHFEFSSQRTFATAKEAEEYMCRFACDRIDSQLRR